jgi:hypothetical protein
MNNEFSWFDEEGLRYFISLLRKFPNYTLSKHLPVLSENWYQEILNCLERLQLPYYKSNYERLSSLFYNIRRLSKFIAASKSEDKDVMVDYLTKTLIWSVDGEI